MAVHGLQGSRPIFNTGSLDEERKKRRFRWRIFRFSFVLLYFGITLDIVTTALGFLKLGPRYEANPLVGWLISQLGWGGLAFLLTSLSWGLYKSFKAVYWYLPLKWSAILNAVFLVALAIRWLVVASAVVYIAQG